ncbi:MAG TPA: ribonuclease Y [Chloroflexia bacterium]|nr:ribonuclease Y [Chloroflexia bacterium]
MPELVTWLLAGLVVILIIAVVAVVAAWNHSRADVARAQKLADEQVKTAEEKAAVALREVEAQRKEILLQAKEQSHQIRSEVEAEYRERRAEVQRQERRLQQKEENLDRKLEANEKRERALQAQERELEAEQAKISALLEEQRKELERVAGMTAEQAKTVLLAEIEDEVRIDAGRRYREIENEIKEEADERIKKVLSIAAARAASEYVPEITVSIVPLPNDEMKGRIIGREGRNIRAIEQATGVDLIIDETPEAITLSAFDPVRREVARRALLKLIADGRIHPARIEEVVAKAKAEVENQMREEGEKAAYAANVQGLHPELIKLLGRLMFRTSYGQNQLHHAIEASRIAAAIAAEIGADVNVARTATLLHDIGKAVDHEVEGPHALIGAELAKRLGRSQRIVHAIAAHHNEEEPQTVEAWIVQAADALSGGRPGARRDSVENYIKRLEALEAVANSFEGVEKSFAIQAGREVRMLVQPESIDDLGAMRLARDVAKKIEESLEYPGQIKVTVVRETRAIEYAK